MHSFTIERTVKMPLDQLWAVMGDFENSPAPGIVVEVVKEGDRKLGGTGIIRKVTVGRDSVRQNIDTVDPLRSYTYRIIGHPLLKYHRARADFKADQGSTQFYYHTEFTPTIPLTGDIASLKLKAGVNKFIDLIEKQHCRA